MYRVEDEEEPSPHRRMSSMCWGSQQMSISVDEQAAVPQAQRYCKVVVHGIACASIKSLIPNRNRLRERLFRNRQKYPERVQMPIKNESPSSEESASPGELAKLSSAVSLLSKEAVLIGASQPLIPQDLWNQMTGDEYDSPDVVEALAKTGLHMATTHENNGWVDWKGSLPENLDAGLEHEEILLYTGSTLRCGFGSDVPWIKSVSVIPMAPVQIADLMMDSSRSKTYNSLSLGREDLKLFPSLPLSADTSSSCGGSDISLQKTKMVRNIIQLPVSNKKVESVSLLSTWHLKNGAYLLVSRAIGGTKYYGSFSHGSKVGRSYILLGVNLFEPIPGSADECRMTAITHAFSPGVPLLLAGKVGVKSAKNFVKDIRAVCVPAQL